MAKTQTAQYGSWKSPITSDLIVSDVVGFGQTALDGEDVYWLEGRPTEGGRSVIVRRTADGVIEDVIPAPFNARSRVHEYGGGAYTAYQGTVYFVNFIDQRIYRVSPGGEPEALTPESKRRYADLVVDEKRNRIICVVEDHSLEDQEAENSLVSIDLETGEIAEALDEGNDFYGYAVLSPDGDKLAWLTWNHPNMPWDGTELWTAKVTKNGKLQRRKMVAGGYFESIFQPDWSPDGTLYFVSDRSEWWNLYSWDGEDVQHVLEMDAEFGLPQWVFGMSTYGFMSPQTILSAYTQGGVWHLGMVDVENGKLTEIESPYTGINSVQVSHECLVCLAASPTTLAGVCVYDALEDCWETLRLATDMKVDQGYISVPQSLEFPTTNDLTAHGLYYPPKNDDFSAPEGEKPPLLVLSHGGPTAATSSSMSLKIQYWTSRGFAVLDVNYGGSTGYGRSYRTRLNGQWGVVDVEDCENGAKYLADEGLVDSERLIIRGGSAGGYTTLCALIFGDTFTAGASHYGVGDLEALALDTHKFESRYMDSMVGPYPEMKDLYDERSPLKHARDLNCPVIFFQGLDDKIVPPAQSEEMFKAVRAKELPTAYLAYEGEGHGFRKAVNIKKSLDSELYFYSKVFSFDLADPVEPIKIENL